MYLYMYMYIQMYNVLTVDLEYTSLVWGEEMLTLLRPPAGEEPYLALPELIQKVITAHAPAIINDRDCEKYSHTCK